MKKFLIVIFSTLFSTQVFAACSIDGEATACKISELRREDMNPTYSKQSLLKEYSPTPETRLNPSKNPAEKELRNFGPQSSDYSYNTNCQFGVCNPSGTPKLFEQRSE